MTIPSSELVSVTPSVLSAGGAGIATIGVVLTTNARIPIGSVLSFPSAAAVSTFFGGTSFDTTIAQDYFLGFEGAEQTPASILYAQYNQSPVGAYLRGGNISALSLSALQAISGSLDIVIDGYARNASSVNLSGATSFSSAASTIQTQLNGADPSEASVTASFGATFTGNQSGTSLTTTSTVGLISTGDVIAGTGVASGTTIVSQTSGSPGGNGVYLTSLSGTASSASCTASSNFVDVSNVASGTIAIGQYVTGAGVTSVPIIALGTGTGGVGTYKVSGAPQQVASESMVLTGTPVTVVYDSVSGAFVVNSGIVGVASTAAFATGTVSASLLLTQTTGATLSQGAAAATPSAFMNALILVNNDWVTFMTAFDPDQTAFVGSISSTTLSVTSITQGTIAIGQTLYGEGVTAGTTITAGGGLSWTVSVSQSVGSENLYSFAPGGASGNTQKEAFSTWKDTALGGNRFAYVCWDTDITATESVPATGSLGYLLANNDDSGTSLNYAPDAVSGPSLAAFICGAAASIDFEEEGGRITFAYKAQAGLVATVTDPTTAANLAGNPQSPGSNGNGYNFYGAYATAGQSNIWYQRGVVTGEFAWLDSYINQIWLNNQLQIALLTMFGNVNSIPFTNAGATIIEQALQPAIAAGLTFGAYGPGTITAAQAQDVNSATGNNAANILQTQGWYLQIVTASGSIKSARGPQQINFFYLDNGSVQVINLASIAVS